MRKIKIPKKKIKTTGPRILSIGSKINPIAVVTHDLEPKILSAIKWDINKIVTTNKDPKVELN